MSDPIDEIRRICNDAGDDLLSRISTVLGFDNIVAELQAENERQRNEIKSLTERDTRLVKARDDARDEVDALKSRQMTLLAEARRDIETLLSIMQDHEAEEESMDNDFPAGCRRAIAKQWLSPTQLDCYGNLLPQPLGGEQS